MIFLFIAQSLVHSMRLTFCSPCEIINSLSASTCMPRRTTPCTVGKRGSFQPVA